MAEDASTDASLVLCKQLAQENERVILFQHQDKGNHGAAETRNLGIKKSTSDFIAFLDADDYYLPNRFDAEKTLFNNEKIEGIFGALQTEFITEKGKAEFQEKFKNTELTTVQYQAEGKEIFVGLLGLSTKIFGSFFHLNTLTVRRSSLIKYNLFFNKDLRVHQDSDFIIKLSYHCHLKTGIIDKAIAIRGVHDDNRITKIKLYSKKYNERQFLLWKSLFEWSKNQKLDSDVKERIYLQYKAFDLSLKSKFHKIFALLIEILKKPSILKTKYRFTYLNKYEAS
ncbi:glycosyltransferase family 2 protein [Chryseobacterium sp. 3008163]|uniref:glycosyltransferase family 2 protein n=1 Tax=Chryseobacterium sp. 3008163 TaxID=2478663 RepID=UPI001E35A50C|nr:glycosyltransferase family 2 protein [Chryseobacterium sp. 3008163]